MDLRSDGIALGTLTGSGTVINTYGGAGVGNGIMTVGLGDASSTFSGSIMGKGQGGNGSGLGGGNAGLTSLVKTGTGMLMLSGGGFSYSGPTTVSSGTLTLDNVGNNFASSISIASPATLVLSASINSEYNIFGFSEGYNLAITGGGRSSRPARAGPSSATTPSPVFPARSTFKPASWATATPIRLGAPAPRAWWSMSPRGRCWTLRSDGIALGTLTGSGTVINTYGGAGVGGGILTVGVGDASSTFSGSILGKGQGGNGSGLGGGNAGLTSLVKTGTGMFMLSGGGFTYAGPTTVSSGTLTLDNVGNTFVSSPSIAPAATLVLSATGGLDTNVLGFGNSATAITGSGTIVKTGAGWTEFDYNVIQGFSGQIYIQSGVLGNGEGHSTWGAAPRAWGSISPRAQLELRGNGITVGTLTGSGTVFNSYGDFATGNGILTVGQGDASSTFSGSITSNQGVTSLVKTGSGNFTLSGGGLTYTGSTTVSSGTLTLANVGNTFVSSPSIAPAATLVLSATGGLDTNVLGCGNSTTAIAGSGTIVKTGAGWTEFDYNVIQGFSGQIDIQAGILGNGEGRSTWAPAPRAWGSISPRGTVGLRGNGITVGTLTGSGTVFNSYGDFATGNGVLTVGLGDASSTFSGSIIGTGLANNNSINAGVTSLVKTGSGILTLAGPNTYTGGTIINNGTLSVAADSNLGSVPGSFAASNIILNGGTLQANGSFTLNSNRGIWLGTVSPAIDVTAGNALTYGGVLADANTFTGSLTKTDSGVLVLSGSNTYSGGTTISGGTLQISTSANLGTGSLAFNGNGHARYRRLDRLLRYAVNHAHGQRHDPGGQHRGGHARRRDLRSADFFKTGPGNLILSNSSNNFGSTTVEAGC